MYLDRCSRSARDKPRGTPRPAPCKASVRERSQGARDWPWRSPNLVPAEARLLPAEGATLLRPIVAIFIRELIDSHHSKRTAQLARGVEGEGNVTACIDAQN